MVTMYDCILRESAALKGIVHGYEKTFAPLWAYLGDGFSDIDEICLIGSGTSYTAGVTARYLAQNLSGIRVTVEMPNPFLNSLGAINPKALYVFVSQTGTSTITRKALEMVKAKGYKTAAISYAADTPIAKIAGAYIDMGCGVEECGMRTVGYSCSVMTIAFLGLALGIKRKNISAEETAQYIAQANAAAENIDNVIEIAGQWATACRRKMLRSDCIVITGADALFGVGLEAAVKIWEGPQIVSIGYELEEGLHAPNYGYNHNHAVVVLNDGGVDNDKALALARYMKGEMDNGFIVGCGAIDDQDMPFEIKGGAFAALEFAAAVQVLAHRLAVDGGRDFSKPNQHGNMSTYFTSHDD